MSYAIYIGLGVIATLEVVNIIIWLMKNRLLDEWIPMLTWLYENQVLIECHGKHKETEVSLFCQMYNITSLDDEMSN